MFDPAIDRAADDLKQGRLVIMPTETVYGLAADASNAAAVAAIYQAKGRPSFNPLIAHVADLDAARAIAVLDERAERLADAFWPGPLTIVAPIRDTSAVCDLARAGLDTVAVRVPAHPVALALIKAFGGAVAAPSANRSGRPSPTTLADAMDETGAFAAEGLQGGACQIGLESTVIGLVGQPLWLRAGGARLSCTLGPLRYTWIVASNWLLALVTLGMMFPWCEVRRMRYLVRPARSKAYERKV